MIPEQVHLGERVAREEPRHSGELYLAIWGPSAIGRAQECQKDAGPVGRMQQPWEWEGQRTPTVCTAAAGSAQGCRGAERPSPAPTYSIPILETAFAPMGWALSPCLNSTALGTGAHCLGVLLAGKDKSLRLVLANGKTKV